jgi:2-keto-4-pentenoate hydratase/2-oxohepta-3-ene-1,7-dioic acid hydratase in catechol pathway
MQPAPDHKGKWGNPAGFLYKNLVPKINRIVQSLSKVMTLGPGDIISTGTPTGTVLSLSSHSKYLQHGE